MKNDLFVELEYPRFESAGACYNANQAGSFEYIAGVEVSSIEGLPSIFSHLSNPAQKYAVFSHVEDIWSAPTNRVGPSPIAANPNSEEEHTSSILRQWKGVSYGTLNK